MGYGKEPDRKSMSVGTACLHRAWEGRAAGRPYHTDFHVIIRTSVTKTAIFTILKPVRT